MPLDPIKLNVGAMWLHRFDALTSRGVPAREIVVEMAKEMSRLGDLAVQRAVEAPPSPVYACALCGKKL